jgi:NAD(P)-dependent dehydrogenase (short-subunit alcohol dehydrogenase family)
MSAAKHAILVTGASKGLGYATAQRLLELDCCVVTVSRSIGSLKQLQEEYDGKLHVILGDVFDAAIMRRAVDAAAKMWQLRLTGVIFNAGVLDPVVKLDAADARKWQECFQTNLFSIITALPILLPEFRAASGDSQSPAKILLISSGAATGSYQGWSAYGCSKAALNHLAQDLGLEESSITTLSVRPGVVATDMQRAIREQHGHAMEPQQHKKFTELHSSGALEQPEAVAAVLAKLVLSADHALSGKFVNWADYKDL